MKIKKTKKTKEVTRVLSPAMYKDVRTDKVKEVTVENSDGNFISEKRPIYERVFVEPVTEVALIEYDVFEVENNGEVHEFTSEADAKRFLGVAAK